MPRILLAVLALALLAGCRASPRRDAAWGALARPGDAARASVFPPRRGEPLPAATGDPLPALMPGEWRTEAAAGFRDPRAGEPILYRPVPGRPYASGRWSLGNGDLALPLDQAWRLRVGLSAGGVALDDYASDGSRRAFYLSPGVRVERDL